VAYHVELRDWRTWTGLLVVAAVLLGFGKLIWAPFVYDDHALLVDPAITAPDGWWKVWRLEQTRPLTYFTFWVNHSLGGHHAVNLALHLASCLLLLGVAGKLAPPLAAACAAVVFALHPLAVEPVAYVFARGTLLATMLCLVSLLAWLSGRHWLAVVWFALALLAKEECAAFPVFLALLHLSMSRNRAERPPIAAMLGLAVLATARVAVMTTVVEGSGAGAQAGIHWWDYLLTQGTVIPSYLFGLALGIDPAIEVDTGWKGWLGWLAVASLCRFYRFREGFWFLAGIVLLLPTSSIFPAEDLAAERRMYLPMIAFSILAGLLIARLGRKEVVLVCAALLGIVSYQRVQPWMSEAALWEDALAKAPKKIRPRLQLARIVEPGRALQLLKEAEALAPEDPRVPAEMGRYWLAQGKPREALGAFGRAVALAPRDATAYGNRGVALWALGLADEAIADFRRALQLNPCLAEARENLQKAGVAVPAANCP
jgi:hypothetical protein